MLFSPYLIVATASLLSATSSASPFLYSRQAAETNVTSAGNVTDPHASPPVPADFGFGPVANGGKAWADAFAKAKSVVDQMTIEERVNVVS